MAEEPAIKRTYAYFDAQNLYYAAKEAFGYRLPNYDVLKLAQLVCAQNKWRLSKTSFYTGIPDSSNNPFWSHFWSAKFAYMWGEWVYRFFQDRCAIGTSLLRSPMVLYIPHALAKKKE